jgi:hypothetical protein
VRSSRSGSSTLRQERLSRTGLRSCKESSGGNPNFVTGKVSESADLDVVYKYNLEVADHDALDRAIIMDE